MTERTASEFVYFVQGTQGGPIKIGTAQASRIDARLIELQCGNPSALVVRLLIPGGRDLEAQLHTMFRHLRIRGEWFECAGTLLEYLSSQGCLEGVEPRHGAQAGDSHYETAYDAGFDAGVRHAHIKAVANFDDALSLISSAVQGSINKARRSALREVGQCKATIASPPRRGHQCRNPNLPGSDYCKSHKEHEHHVAREAAERMRGVVTRP